MITLHSLQACGGNVFDFLFVCLNISFFSLSFLNKISLHSPCLLHSSSIIFTNMTGKSGAHHRTIKRQTSTKKTIFEGKPVKLTVMFLCCEEKTRVPVCKLHADKTQAGILTHDLLVQLICKIFKKRKLWGNPRNLEGILVV